MSYNNNQPINYLAGATNIVLRGYLYQSGSEQRAARMMQAVGTAAGLTINHTFPTFFDPD